MKKNLNKRSLKVLYVLLILTICMLMAVPAYAKPKISRKKITLVVGKKAKLKVKGTKKKVKWSSSNKSIASVSKKGVVKAKRPGKATIRAKVGKKILKCKVTVKKKTSVSSNTASSNSNNTTAGNGGTSSSTSGGGQPSPPKPKPDYYYRLKILNNPKYKLYTGSLNTLEFRPVVIYVETNNNEYYNGSGVSAYIGMDNCGFIFDTGASNTTYGSHINYADVKTTGYVSNFQRTASGSGFVTFLYYPEPGTYTVTLTDTYQNRKYPITFTVYDYTTEEEAWMRSLLGSICTSSMTNKEKLDAVSRYISQNFKYGPYFRETGDYSLTLLNDGFAWWVHKQGVCTTFSYIMCKFCEMLGVENRYGYSGQAHRYCIATIDGTDYKYDPGTEIKIVESYPILVQ